MRRQCVALAIALFCAPAFAGDPEKPAGDLTEMSLEELMDLEVTSVSRKEQKLSEAPAAVYVITQEDIRRSGARTIPDLLRTVPGVEVAQINASSWAITARGFNNPFAKGMLVLIDGRSVYSPLFAGTFWDVQDTLLPDIERIEVIRGPGASMWGANAVNGVINIITKDAHNTQGALIEAGGGTEEQLFGGARYGAELGENTWLRVYGKYFDRDHLVDAAGDAGADAWKQLRGGFRLDHGAEGADHLTLQGDVYAGGEGIRQTLPTLTPPFSRTFEAETRVGGGNVLGRWTHPFAKDSEAALQLYYDRTTRDTPIGGELRDTLDLDFQHRCVLGSHELVWGVGYRWTGDKLSDGDTVHFDPESRDDQLASAFLQDSITLVPERLVLTVGSKFELNDYSGFEVQPTGRITWTPSSDQTVWAAVSRAVRTPSRADHTVRFDQAAFPDPTTGLPALVSLFGDSDFDSEDLRAIELGYRVQLTRRLSADAATFLNHYDNLSTTEPGTPFPEASPAPPHIVLPLFFDNKMSGDTYGVEVAGRYSVTDSWQLGCGYTFFHMNLHPDSDSQSPPGDSAEGSDPHNQASLHSHWNLPWDLELDGAAYYVDALSQQNVPSYIRLDVRLAWHLTKDIEVSLVGQNLIDDRHPEFGSTIGEQATESQRAVYGMLTCRF